MPPKQSDLPLVPVFSSQPPHLPAVTPDKNISFSILKIEVAHQPLRNLYELICCSQAHSNKALLFLKRECASTQAKPQTCEID